MVLVDTSVWIEAARRDGDLHAKVTLEGLLEEYEAAWCGPVKLEVLGGARPEFRKRLEEQFACIPYQPISERIWEHAKTCSWQLRDQGQTIPWNDILTASLSMIAGCRVYALDHHFEAMNQILGVRLYQPGYGGKFSPEPAN